MKLKLLKKPSNTHTNIVSLINWLGNTVYSFSDDLKSYTWNMNAECLGKFIDLDTFYTAADWNTTSKGGNELLAVGTSDGLIKILSRNGKIEKSISAHSMAVTSVHWSFDGSTLVSCSEDGNIKTWSKQAELRNHIVKDSSSIYSVKWNHDASFIAFCFDNYISIEPVLKGGLKSLKWKAHDELVLCIDWNSANKLIISGGEDKKYKIWDQYGRNLFTSIPYNYVMTSIAWSPSGEYFAVGSYETIRLCNKTGWAYSFNKVESGGIMALSWSNDGNMIAAAGGNGSVVVGSLVERSICWQNLEIKLDENNKLIINDFEKQTLNEIDFRDNLVNMKAGYGYLIVLTLNQCHIYPFNNLNAPFKFDLKDKIRTILTCPQYFALIDDNNGISIFTYDGKQIPSPQLQGIRISSLSSKSISLSNDILAIISPTNQKQIRLFDLSSGKPLNNIIEHSMEISEISLNQSSGTRDRKVCFIDNNKDLYLSNVYITKIFKICGMCDTFSWNESNDMLSAVADEKYYTWIYPNAIYIDKELLDGSKYEKDATEIGRNCQIISFSGSLCNILKSDGSLCHKAITPYANILLNLLNYQDGIEKALKLCRYVKDKILWTAFSSICINYSEIPVAETALAAIDEVDKVGFIDKIISMKGKFNEALVHSYILLLSNRVEEAESVLLQSKLVYRAIKLNINLFRWDRAYNLALQNKVHIDTVLAYRNKYLEGAGLEETNSKFIELGKEIKVDWTKIKAEIEKDKKVEKLN